MKIGYIKMHENAIEPEVSYEGTSNTMGIDLFTLHTQEFKCPGTSNTDEAHPHPSILPYCNFSTGIQFNLPLGVHLSWGGRSGLAFKHGRIAFEGKIDSNYTGEVAVKMWSMNPEDNGVVIQAGTKIAQLYIVHYNEQYELEEVTVAKDSTRGTSGFGSTG